MLKIKTAKITAAIIALLFLLPQAVQAGDIPSLFTNDEEWYKDSAYPLVIRDGKYFVPADIFTTFDYVSVTVHDKGNLLIHNTRNGGYISVLFKDQSAAVNGDIIEGVGVFRDDGVYYVDSELVCRSIGLKTEVYTSDTGEIHVRIADSEKMFKLDELIEKYTPEDEEYLEDADEDIVKRIYILCTSPDGKSHEFPARELLDEYGLEYTLFLDADSSRDTVLAALADGEYGLSGEGAESLDLLNTELFPYTRRVGRLTLSTGDSEADTALREAGYIPIVPDFTVNGASYADGMLSDIISYLGEHERCTLYLEDTWNSRRMIMLLSEIDYKNYITSNLTEMEK